MMSRAESRPWPVCYARFHGEFSRRSPAVIAEPSSAPIIREDGRRQLSARFLCTQRGDLKRRPVGPGQAQIVPAVNLQRTQWSLIGRLKAACDKRRNRFPASRRPPHKRGTSPTVSASKAFLPPWSRSRLLRLHRFLAPDGHTHENRLTSPDSGLGGPSRRFGAMLLKCVRRDLR